MGIQDGGSQGGRTALIIGQTSGLSLSHFAAGRGLGQQQIWQKEERPVCLLAPYPDHTISN